MNVKEPASAGRRDRTDHGARTDRCGAPPTSRSPSSCLRTGRCWSQRCGSCPPPLPCSSLAQIVSPWRPHGHDWWRTAVLALFNFGLFFPLLAVAVYRLPGGVAAAAGGLQPLLVAGLTWLSSRRTPSRRDIEIGVRRRRRCRSRRPQAERRHRHCRPARGARGQPLVRRGRRAHEALSLRRRTAWRRRRGSSCSAGCCSCRSCSSSREPRRRCRQATWPGSPTSASSAPRLRSCCGSTASASCPPLRLRSSGLPRRSRERHSAGSCSVSPSRRCSSSDSQSR